MAASLSGLKVKIFADGADREGMLELAKDPLIRGFTTNPSLMRKAGVSDYEGFAREILAAVGDRPVSLEVLADEFEEMERQARRIAQWGGNAYVKIPVSNTRGETTRELVRRLSHSGVKVNVTALLTLEQVEEAAEALAGGAPSCISVFAGRIADTGRDPVPVMAAAAELIRPHGQIELIWASTREVLNIFQADAAGCQIITVPHEILKKLPLVGKDLVEYSLETVRMFHRDAQRCGLKL